MHALRIICSQAGARVLGVVMLRPDQLPAAPARQFRRPRQQRAPQAQGTGGSSGSSGNCARTRTGLG
jgi:hypothetical protein